VAVEFGLLILGAYLLGSVPAAYLVAKWSRGIDIRQYGSGNVGASNVLTLVSKRWGIPVIIFDLVKGMVAVYIAQLIGLSIIQQVATGIAVIIGHNWPVFLRLSGGRGILTTLGVALILPAINSRVPWEAIIALAIVALTLFVFHNFPLGVIGSVTSLPIVSWTLGEPLPITLGFAAMFLIAVIRRLAVPRTPVTASVSTGQLLLNRLLFDRDIRDREAWIHQTRPQAGPFKQQSKERKTQGKGDDK